MTSFPEFDLTFFLYFVREWDFFVFVICECCFLDFKLFGNWWVWMRIIYVYRSVHKRIIFFDRCWRNKCCNIKHNKTALGHKTWFPKSMKERFNKGYIRQKTPNKTRTCKSPKLSWFCRVAHCVYMLTSASFQGFVFEPRNQFRSIEGMNMTMLPWPLLKPGFVGLAAGMF